MDKNKHTHKNNNQQGQALLFIVVAMTIALSIGINASVRTITSLSRTTRTDTAARALAAAEGGIERFLALSTSELEDAADGTCPEDPLSEGSSLPAGDAPNSCVVSFDTTGDIIVSQAHVNVQRYIPDPYTFSLASGEVKEINLYNYTDGIFYGQSSSEYDVTICWSSAPASDIMYVSYNSSGIQTRGILTGDNPPDLPYSAEGATIADSSNADFDDCHQVDIGSNIYGLRIRSLGGSSDIGVYGVDEDLPIQGYRIISVGKLRQVSGVTATRIIRVVRTLPYLPVSFDYALYSTDDIFK
jgi:hypothetical protein